MINLSMQKKYTQSQNVGQNISESSKNKISVNNKVDINILLNRVRSENFKEKKKNFAFIICIFSIICLSGYLIFN